MQTTSEKPKEAIIKTLAYFDGLEMPLTAFEVWQYLLSRESYTRSVVEDTLEELSKKRILKRHGAFFCLPERQQIVDSRIQRGFSSEQKFAKARSAIKILRYVPFVRMVAVCNTLAFDMTRREGDIDLFIVVRRGRLYFTRALITGVIQLLGWRRHGLSIADRICLSFFVDEDGMDMSRFEINNSDPYLAYWTQQLIPIFSIQNTYNTFWHLNKVWLETYFSDPRPYVLVGRRKVKDALLSRFLRLFSEALLTILMPLLERIARLMQKRKMRKAHERHVRLSSSAVVIDDHTLKFHEEDRRVFYRDHMLEQSSKALKQNNA